MSDILSTVDLEKRFGRTVVLDGLSMAVPEGAIYGLVGPNGAGKSTTIKILMNIYGAERGERGGIRPRLAPDFTAPRPDAVSGTYRRTRRCRSG